MKIYVGCLKALCWERRSLFAVKMLLLAMVILSSFHSIRAEEHASSLSVLLDFNISGTVTDSEGVTLPGVSVTIKGTNQGAITDENGKYVLTVPEGAVLVYSFVGFESQEVPVDGRTEINIALSEQTTALDEVVVVAYGTQKKTSTTAAVSTLDLDEVKNEVMKQVATAFFTRRSATRFFPFRITGRFFLQR